MMKKFDEIIRKKVEEFNPEADEQLWRRIERRIRGGGRSSPSQWLSLLVVSSLMISAGIYIYLTTKNLINMDDGSIPLIKDISQPRREVTNTEASPAQQPLESQTPTPNYNHDIRQIPNKQKHDDIKNTPMQEQLNEDIFTHEGGKTILKVDEVEKNETETTPNRPIISEMPEKKPVEESSLGVVPTIKASRWEGCLGEEISFWVDTQINGRYKWDFGDKHYSYQKKATHAYKLPGSYLVSLKIQTDKGEVNITASQNIIIKEKPEARIDVIESDNSISFINNSESRVLHWIVNGKKQSTQDNTLRVDMPDKPLKVELIVENKFGCRDTASLTYNPEDRQKPNTYIFDISGEGTYQTWLPYQHIPNEYSSIKITIVSQSGMTVFTTHNAEEGWDGTIAGSGNKAKTGEKYIWIMEWTDMNGKNHKKTGLIIVQ